MDEAVSRAIVEALDAIDVKGVVLVRIGVTHSDGSVHESETRVGAAPEPGDGEIARAVDRRAALEERLKRRGLR